MYSLISRLGEHSVVRFAVVGCGNTLFGLLLIYALIGIARVPDVPANLLGYVAGTVLSFIANSNWAFRFSGARVPAFLRFVVVLFAAYLANLLVVILAIDGFSVNHYLAHAFGVIPYALIGYLGSRYFVFLDRSAVSNSESNNEINR